MDDAVPIPRPIALPYETETPRQLLQKIYQVGSLTWTAAWAGTHIDFPKVLLDVITMQCTFKRFRYFRANIHVEIKLTSTVFHQGALIIGHLPGWTGVTMTPYTLSGCNAVVLSAATQDSAIIKMPYVCPMDWIDTLEVGDSTIGRLFIRVLTALTPTAPNQATSIPVAVYAKFEDIEVGGFVSHMSEARAKVNKGFDAKTAVTTASKILRTAPVIGPAYGVIADGINAVAGDLAKPNSNQAPQSIYMNRYPGSSYCRGVTQAEEFTMYPNHNLNQTKVFCGMQTSHMTVNEMARRPMLHDQVTLTNSSKSFELTVHPMWMPGTELDWLSYISTAFRRWRGSIKYSFMFVLPAFYSVKVRFSYIDQRQETVVDYGDILNKVVDLKGETWIDMEIPWFKPFEWEDIRTCEQQLLPFSLCGRLRVELMSDILGSSAPTTPVVPVNVFRAGGEDVAFIGLWGARDIPVTEKEAQAHCSIGERFKKPFDGIVSGVKQSCEKGFVAAEVAGTVSDCMRRWSSHIPISSVAITYPCLFADGTANGNWGVLDREPFHYFNAVFLFWRGDRLFRRSSAPYLIGTDRIGFTDATGGNAIFTWGDGVAEWYVGKAATARQFNMQEVVRVPWVCSSPWISTEQEGSELDTTNYTQIQTESLYPNDININMPDEVLNSYAICAGDYFMAMYPVPLFPQIYRKFPPEKPTTTASQPSGRKLVQ